jgi:phosphoribosyl 1,2-cyclic phosphodiesterase
LLVIDAGTGIRSLQHSITSAGPHRLSLFLTHYHWDHIQGLPMFTPLQYPGVTLDIHGAVIDDRTPREVLARVMGPPWWPVTLAECRATVRYHPLEGPVTVGRVTVSPVALNHPQGVTGFRLDAARSIMIATDHESGEPAADARLRELARGVGVLVHDAQYTPQERRDTRRGWGHSDWEAATAAARDAGARRLVITSHDPDRTDEQIDAIRGMARSRFPKTDAAFEGMTIPL